MSLKANEFTAALDTFFDVLQNINHYRYFNKLRTKDTTQQIQKIQAAFETRGKLPDFWMATAMGIVDIFHHDAYVIREPTGSRRTQFKDALRLADEMERRFNALLFVTLFESLESYLKSLYGEMLYRLRNDITIKDKKKFHRWHPNWSKKKGTQPYYVHYAAYACKRDCTKALDEFAKQLNWKRVAIHGRGEMTFHELIRVIGLCRHCIVHREGRIADDTKSGLSKAQAAFVDSCLHEGLHLKESLILPDSEIVDDCIEAIASYARGLYILLSERCRMNDEKGFFKSHRLTKKRI